MIINYASNTVLEKFFTIFFGCNKNKTMLKLYQYKFIWSKIMDIAKIDKNFAESFVEKNNELFDVYKIPNSKIDLYGVFYENDGFVRLPKEVASKTSEGVLRLRGKTSGGRVRFSSNSKFIKIIVRWKDKYIINHMPGSSVYGFTLQEDFLNGRNRFLKTFIPPVDCENGYESQFELRNRKLKYFTLYFPLYNNISELYILVDKGSILDKGLKYKDIKPIVYYGSSITQGACASRPDNSYEAMISKWNNVDFINLGFSGNCKGEETIVKYIASLDASLFVCDYDYNAPDVKFLKDTHYNVYKTYREINPTTPILFISKPDFNPYKANSLSRLTVIKETYEKAKLSGDNNVYFLDGRKLYKNKFDLCTVDGIHPNDLGFYFMAKAINKMLEKIIKDNKLLGE